MSRTLYVPLGVPFACTDIGSMSIQVRAKEYCCYRPRRWQTRKLAKRSAHVGNMDEISNGTSEENDTGDHRGHAGPATGELW